MNNNSDVNGWKYFKRAVMKVYFTYTDRGKCLEISNRISKTASNHHEQFWRYKKLNFYIFLHVYFEHILSS